MNQPTILPFFYPTTVMCVDDAEDALRAINGVLLMDDFLTVTYSDVDVALLHINRKDLMPIRNWFSNRSDEFCADSRTQSIRYNEIHQILFDEKRSEQVSVLIVDYDMPGMNGLEFCQKITNPYTRKILLTGVADEKIGINALNKGIIHQYLRKQDPNLPDNLRKAVKLAQKNYFEILGAPIINVSRCDPKSIFSYQETETFLDRYLHQAAEYYLCSPAGSFVFLDSEGKQSGFVIKHAEELDSDAELTEEIASSELSADLKSYQKLLRISPNTSFFGMNPAELESMAFPAQPIPNIPDFFVANANPLGDSSAKVASGLNLHQQGELLIAKASELLKSGH